MAESKGSPAAGPDGDGRPADRGSALADYVRKRDFTQTTEPRGSQAQQPAVASARFVVQEHHARSLHWDFRLEMGGVLRSWAVPKGPPIEPGVKRLAIAVEDHPLEYMDFEGVIPPGNYGAGTVSIWDRGGYGVLEATDDAMLLRLHGIRLQGLYQLVRTRGTQWLMWKRNDSPVGPAGAQPID